MELKNAATGFGWNEANQGFKGITAAFSKQGEPNDFQLFHSYQLTAAFIQQKVHSSFFTAHS
jgi:hypothetical protein